MARTKKGKMPEWFAKEEKKTDAFIDKIAIVIGGATKRRDFYQKDVPDWERPGVEIWGLNGIRFSWVPKWTRMFNVHRLELLEQYAFPVETEIAWSAINRDVPFYVADSWKGQLFNEHIFPAEALKAAYPRGDYHCNSGDWFIAFALYSGFRRIHFCGWNMMSLMEQMSARACFEYWAGFAEAKGMRVTTGKECDLFYPYHIVRSNRVYGYDDCPAWEDRTRDAKSGPPYRFD